MHELLADLPYDMLMPYLQFTGTISNIQEQDTKRVILNNIWIRS